MSVENLNFAELVRCVAHPIECNTYRVNANKALAWANGNAPPGVVPWRNIYDAQRHVYWSALLTREFGDSALARIWTDLHEVGEENAADVCMDQHNNRLGREIGTNLGPNATDSQIVVAILLNPNLQDSIGC